MIFQILAIIVLAVYGGIYVGKMLMQRRKGIKQTKWQRAVKKADFLLLN